MLHTDCISDQKSLAQDYAQALELSFQYFEAQRSGPLPSNQRVTWRANSALQDGKAQGIDLAGGYYDAGDNVKFQFPMAYTITTLAWGVIEYRSQLEQLGQLQYALDAGKWGTDYFIKAHPEPNVLWAEVGDWRDRSRLGQELLVSLSGYNDELLWAAMWLLEATSEPYYQNYVVQNAVALVGLAGTGSIDLNWDSNDYLARNSQTLTCSGQLVQPSELLALAQQQVDYILGTNPKNLSYMVGWRGDEFDLKLDIHQELVSKWRGKGMFFKVQCTVTNHNEHAVKKLILQFLTSNELKGTPSAEGGRTVSLYLNLKAFQPGESYTYTFVSVEAVKAKISVKQALLE
ncbi:hypothetical protein R1sor_000013 [Riccia sorocarpa]|uniref:cellulase n=1 Tax=Riccia sorocarpa TaxID=122646 RepID=A0ABD3GTU2_9MARC